jgi:hypothetical protein
MRVESHMPIMTASLGSRMQILQICIEWLQANVKLIFVQVGNNILPAGPLSSRDSIEVRSCQPPHRIPGPSRNSGPSRIPGHPPGAGFTLSSVWEAKNHFQPSGSDLKLRDTSFSMMY